METDGTDRLRVETPGETWDPLTGATTVLGKKWHLVVLHRLSARGPLGFNALVRSIDGLSNKVLSACLDDLQGWGLVARRVVSERPYRVEYDLTAAGRSVEPLLAAMADWGDTAVERVESRAEADVSVPR